MAMMPKMTESLMRGLSKSSSWSQPSMRSLVTAAAPLHRVVPPAMTEPTFAAPLHRGVSQTMAELAWSTAAPITQAKALHPRFYIDEEYVAAEREANTSIVLTRDKAGKLNAFYNVCRHRGARICQTSQKACKQLVCPYHWWAYRLDGSLKSTPPAATPKERKETLGLRRVPGVEIFAGMVFLNQSPNPPPLSDFLGDLPEKLIRYDLDDLELSQQKDYNIKGDWKLIAENFVDFYHINAVHPELAKFSRVDDHLPYQGRGQYVGFVTAPLSDSGGPGDSYHFNQFPRLKSIESSSALFFQIFPNVSVTIYPHSVYTLMTFPTSTPGVTQERLSLLMAPTARKKEDDDNTYQTKCKNLMDFVVNINNEDVVAIENLQHGLMNARHLGIQGEFIPEYDWPVHRFQNMILGGLKASSFDETLAPKLCNKFEEQVMASL
eukprot:CAMPEP_0169299768 /NCGR_PEP_ID=MMETSP1016-20121227/67263_1 /TAXON_ID=342587 /ORGANISM="Karlodinium micrum, Strain CCMP2283" /LENGTH=435 /DNA_ID=CAMNT_0009392075 /DNA_START=54 /DNA_END=1361 /DNA_ORIENTATION=+